MKDKAHVELTAREATLISLLRSVPIASITIGQATEVMKLKLETDALIEKVHKAFEQGDAPQAAEVPQNGQKRKRH